MFFVLLAFEFKKNLKNKMKKLITLLSFILLMGSSSRILSQSLANTAWSVYDDFDNFFTHFHFDGDTLSYSSDSVIFTPVSTYQENGNTFTIVDVLPSTCPGDTGYYTFYIQNDTLIFTLISDSCPTRPQAFTDYNWVRFPTGIKTINVQLDGRVFPNPFSEKLMIESNEASEIILYDFVSRKLLQQKFTGDATLNTEHLGKGIYIYELIGNSGIIKRESL
jgi:hypothetical protein